jgi:hypothetical protein
MPRGLQAAVEWLSDCASLLGSWISSWLLTPIVVIPLVIVIAALALGRLGPVLAKWSIETRRGRAVESTKWRARHSPAVQAC